MGSADSEEIGVGLAGDYENIRETGLANRSAKRLIFLKGGGPLGSAIRRTQPFLRSPALPPFERKVCYSRRGSLRREKSIT